jgi:hypothetical protein
MVQDFEVLFFKTLGIPQARQTDGMEGQLESMISRRAG